VRTESRRNNPRLENPKLDIAGSKWVSLIVAISGEGELRSSIGISVLNQVTQGLLSLPGGDGGVKHRQGLAGTATVAGAEDQGGWVGG
jgi:hypothetical protein